MTAFRAEAFFVKARLFVNRAMEPGDARSEDERRLWAALALELLAKWALAETSPVLVADPAKDGGDQLFMALGLKEAGPTVTVQATTAFKRCQSIYHPFNAQDAAKFSTARNEYLHGSEIALLAIPADLWWSRYWSLVNVLLTAHQRVLEDLVGSARVAEVEAHLARNAERNQQQYEAAVEAARRNLARYQGEQMSAAEARRWEHFWHETKNYDAEVECPACGAMGTAGSDDAQNKDVTWSDDAYETYPTIEVTFVPDFFSCPKCHLVLDNYDLIEVAEMNEEHIIETDEPIYDEPEYGND